MSATLFKKVDYSLDRLIQGIEMGEIGLPDIQRPFVWSQAKVRDLFDSMYKGFPVGFLLFWSNDQFDGARQIGLDEKQMRVPRLLIVDGQQRLTSLYAVLRGLPILDKNYRQVYLRIAFNPFEAEFKVSDATTQRDPEFIPDISEVWKGGGSYRYIKGFIDRLRQAREVDEDEEGCLSEAIDRLFDLHKYTFTAMEISSTVDEEQVADIFVRINSKGVQLRQADFILTLLSVFWDKGRMDLERFSRESRKPTPGRASPFNHFIEPDPDQLLRVSVAVGFKRARLQHVYSILRGKDLETGEFSDERRVQQFEVLKEAQNCVLNLTDWHEFLKVLVRAGFRSNAMITSEITLLYTYAFFLIGKNEYGIEPYTLRNLMARWFFIVALTRRYTGSPESVMDQDLARLRSVRDAEGFVATLERIIESEATNDFWEITLPEELATSSARTPTLYAYYAALNLLDARVLFSHMKVSELLDPALQGHRRAVERHHLFPKAYLKRLGYDEVRETNQIANYALVEWGDNTDIADLPPADYFPAYAARFANNDLRQMMEWHALPEGWHTMDYETFLAKRRQLIAGVIRRGFESLPRT